MTGEYDPALFVLGMDQANMRNILCIIGSDPEHKVKMLLDYSSHPRAIADPWYTGNFDVTYEDVVEGCTALLKSFGLSAN